LLETALYKIVKMQVDDIKGKTPAKSHETGNGCLIGFILAFFS
jgi:hypothetical protein